MPPAFPRVVGRYLVHAPIASGGMATIHLGRLVGPVGFSRAVAVKRLFDNVAGDPEFVAMFLDEARIAARIRHPNVVPVLDVVSTDSDLLLVMDFVLGESLSFFMKKLRNHDQRIPPAVAVTLIAQVLHGLHAAHEAKNERGEPLGIVHRDVTPQNVLVGADGVARLTDFGIAKAIGRAHQTREGQIKGKVSYMSYEQLLGQAHDRRTDVYSASVVLWELLTGGRLFWAPTDAQSMYQVLEAKPQRPSDLVPDLPKALDDIVMRGLDRDVEKRFPTARDMALELERVVPLASSSVVAGFVQAHAAESVARLSKQLDMLDQVEAEHGVEPPAPSRPRALSIPPEVFEAALNASKAPSVAPPRPASKQLKTVPLQPLQTPASAGSAAVGVSLVSQNPTFRPPGLSRPNAPRAPSAAPASGPSGKPSVPPPPRVPSLEAGKAGEPSLDDLAKTTALPKAPGAMPGSGEQLDVGWDELAIDGAPQGSPAQARAPEARAASGDAIKLDAAVVEPATAEAPSSAPAASAASAAHAAPASAGSPVGAPAQASLSLVRAESPLGAGAPGADDDFDLPEMPPVPDGSTTVGIPLDDEPIESRGPSRHVRLVGAVLGVAAVVLLVGLALGRKPNDGTNEGLAEATAKGGETASAAARPPLPASPPSASAAASEAPPAPASADPPPAKAEPSSPAAPAKAEPSSGKGSGAAPAGGAAPSGPAKGGKGKKNRLYTRD